MQHMHTPGQIAGSFTKSSASQSLVTEIRAHQLLPPLSPFLLKSVAAQTQSKMEELGLAAKTNYPACSQSEHASC